ncbi:uncharacterized protein LOC144167327 [Haemaphysalis longicornis]
MYSDLFFACKHELIRFDVKPGIIKEVNRFCVSFRFCWSVAEERSNNRQTMIDYVFYCLDKLALANMTVKSDWAQKYHYNHTHQLAAFKVQGKNARTVLLGAMVELQPWDPCRSTMQGTPVPLLASG